MSAWHFPKPIYFKLKMFDINVHACVYVSDVSFLRIHMCDLFLFKPTCMEPDAISASREFHLAQMFTEMLGEVRRTLNS